MCAASCLNRCSVMGHGTYLRIVFTPPNSQTSDGRSGRNIQVQDVTCHKICRTTPSVKLVLRRLSQVKETCEIYKRSVLLFDTLKNGVIDATRPREELPVNTSGNLKFSTTVEMLGVTTGSEAERKRRLKSMNFLTDSPVTTTVNQAPYTTKHLDPYIVSRQSEGQKRHCKDASSLVNTPNLYPSIISEEKENPRVGRTSSHGARTRGGVTLTKTLIETRPQRTRRLKRIGKILPKRNVGKNVYGKNVGKNVDKNVSEKSTVMDTSRKKCTGNLKTLSNPKKRGTKRKACSEDSPLQHMIQCFNMFKDSPNDSQRHISQLLGQEIEKIKENNKSVPALKKHYEQHCNNTSGNDDSGEVKVNDHRSEFILEETNIKSQVSDSDFIEKSVAPEGSQKKSISVYPTTVVSPNMNTRMNSITETETIGKILENKASQSQVSLVLTPHHTGHDTQSLASEKCLPPEQHSSASDSNHQMLTQSPLQVLLSPQTKFEFTASQNLQSNTDRPNTPELCNGCPHLAQEPHSYSQHHIQKDFQSLGSPYTQMSHSVVPLHTRTDHSSVSHNCATEPQPSVPQSTHEESHSSYKHTQPHLIHLPKESHIFHEQTEPHVAHKPKESDSNPMQKEPHSSHCKAPPLSYVQTEHNSSNLVCAQNKNGKSRTETLNISTSRYNLRSKGSRSIRRKSMSTNTAKSTNSILKSHCKSELRVCLTRVEHEFPNLTSNFTAAKCLQPRSTASASLSLPVYIPRSLIQLPSENVELQENLEDGVKMEDADGQCKEIKVIGTNIKASTDGSQELVALRKDRKVSVDPWRGPEIVNDQVVPGAQYNQEVIGAPFCQMLVNGENNLKDDEKSSETSNQNYQTVVRNNMMETDVKNHQIVDSVDNNVTEASVEDCQTVVSTVRSVEEKSVEMLQGMSDIDGNIENRNIKEHLIISVFEDKKQTDSEDCPMLDVDNSIVKADHEDIQKMLSFVGSIEGNDTEDTQKMVDAVNSTEETNTEDCQMVCTDYSIENADTEDAQRAVDADSSIEGITTKKHQNMDGSNENIEEACNEDYQKFGAHSKFEEANGGKCKKIVWAASSTVETDGDNCQDMVVAVDSIEMTDSEDCQQVVGFSDSIDESEVNDFQMMVRANKCVVATDTKTDKIVVSTNGIVKETVKEASTESFQAVSSPHDSSAGTGAENCQMVVGADVNVQGGDGEHHQMMMSVNNNVACTDSEINPEITDVVCQVVVGCENADTSVQGRDIEHCLEVVGVNDSVTGTDPEITPEGIGGVLCQFFVKVNTEKNTDVESSPKTDGTDKGDVCKYVYSGDGRASGETSDMMIGAENTLERTVFENCHLMVGADGSHEETVAENCQTYNSNTFTYLMPSLNGVSNTDIFGIHNISMSLEETDMFLNFEPKENSILGEASCTIIPEAPALVSNALPIEEDLQESSAEQSVALAVDDKTVTEADGNILSGQCETVALDHSICPDPNKEEENMLTQYIYLMPNEAQILEALKSSFTDSEECHSQENTDNLCVTTKENLANENLKAERCSERKADSRKEDTRLPGGSDTTPHPVLGSQKSGSTFMGMETGRILCSFYKNGESCM